MRRANISEEIYINYGDGLRPPRPPPINENTRALTLGAFILAAPRDTQPRLFPGAVRGCTRDSGPFIRLRPIKGSWKHFGEQQPRDDSKTVFQYDARPIKACARKCLYVFALLARALRDSLAA